MYPHFSKDERYLNMLGNPGSNPLELFWDVVDSLDQKLEAKVTVAEAAIKRHNEEKASEESGDKSEIKPFKFTPDTTKAELMSIIKDDEGIKTLDDDDIEIIYRTVCYLLPVTYSRFIAELHRCASKPSSSKRKKSVEPSGDNATSKMTSATLSRRWLNPLI